MYMSLRTAAGILLFLAGDPVLTLCWLLPPQVFLREAERQRLQSLLHGEVLRRIVALQRHFRARRERRQFVRMREAAVCIQVRDRVVSLFVFYVVFFSHFVVCKAESHQ